MTVATSEEALKACKDGADYLGIGTVFSTATKTNTKEIIGTAGTKQILSHISKDGKQVRTVSIGGINASNVQRVLYQSSHEEKPLNGVAIVSAIIAAKDPKEASAHLLKLIRSPPPFARGAAEIQEDMSGLVQKVAGVIQAVGKQTPLSHNMTNLVVQNFAASVALAVGGSPSMCLPLYCYCTLPPSPPLDFMQKYADF